MSSYRSLLLELSNSLTIADLQELKFLCADVIPAGRLERITQGIELFGAMEELNMLSEENRDFLASKLIAVNRNDLRNKLLGIQDGAELTARAVCQVTRQNEKDWGSTEIMKIQQEPKEGMQGLTLVPVTSLPRQTSLTTVYLDVHIDCDSITGPGLPGRGVPSAQDVLDYIRFKFFKSSGPRELEGVKCQEQNVHCGDMTTGLGEECSPVIEPGPQKKDTTVGHGDSENERIYSAKVVDLQIDGEVKATTSPSTSLPTGADTIRFSSAQEVLDRIATKYLEKVDPPSPEDLNSFLDYLKKTREVLIVDVKTGSLIITTECSSLEILDELWKAHCTGTLNRMTQSLVTEDILKTFGLTEVKLITTIVEEEYEACREVFLKQGAVPLDIQARGPLATEVYNRELKKGEGYARRVPIMIIGQARTGKTSLKKSLKGELFNPNEGSTRGIETDPSYFKVTTDIWRIGRNSEDTKTEPEFLLDRQLAQNIFKGLKEKERLGDPSTSGTKPSVNDSKEVEPSEANSPPTKRSDESSSNRFEPSPQDSKVVEFSVEPEELKTSSSVTEQSEKEPSAQDSKDHQKVPENVAAWVEKLLKENKEFMEGDDMYSVIWDFGGQSVFYDTHPIFLTEKAIYILTCDLSCDPYKEVDTPVRQDRYCQEIRDKFCEKTNFHYLDFWMSSIHSLVSNSTNRQETSSSETLPAVFLACTHADEPYTKEGSPSLEIFRDLRKIYGSLLRDVFLVDNTKSGSDDECEGVKELREKVRSVAAELPQMNVPIPLEWLRYEKVLYLMRKEGREKISIEDARKIASDKCGIDGEENFRTALNFLHDQKVLINFDESPGLERMVILNPQWLVDVLKEIITFKGFNHNDKNVEGLWCEFEESGILKRELLDRVWKRFIDDQNTCESLIEMMEKFSLLCQWPSEGNTERYLVPSMLKSKPTSKFPNPGVETPSLFVKFKSRRVPPGGVPQGREPQGREPPGRVPPGLFSRLIVLFHHWVQDQVKIKHKKRNQPKPCSNYAMFRIVPEDDISAALLCYSSLIEIVFVLEGDFLDERRLNISHGIHQQLGLILEGMRKEFSWLRHMDYELCVACSVCCGEKSSSSCGPHGNRGCDCLHLFSEEELKDPFCDRKDDGASCRVAKEKFHLWFSSQEELEEFLRSFGGSTIHDEIIDNVNAMDLLARGLDKRIRLGEQELQRNLSYWKHLAEHFKVLREDMMMWQHPHERSPSRKMFELLDSRDPGFSVEKLKQKLNIMKRNDLVEMLKGTATLQDLFENKIYNSICVQLDYNGSWQTLGLELGISRETRERIAIDSSTSYFQTVLEIVRTREPYLTVKEMRDFFEKEKRRDVCNVLPEGGTIQTLLEDIERLESLSVLLDKESPVLKNWRHFARKFGVSLDECNNLKPEPLSPTKTLMEYIVQVEPKLTVKTLIEALKKIGRRDVVLALAKFFLDRSRTKQDANEKSVSADEEVPKSP